MHTFLDMQYIGFAFAISFFVPKVLEPCKAWLLPEAIPALSARFSLYFRVFWTNETNTSSFAGPRVFVWRFFL